MEKPWRVVSPAHFEEQDFATELEAVAYAGELLGGLREEAYRDGEWDTETELIRILPSGPCCPSDKREGNAVDYSIVAVQG